MQDKGSSFVLDFKETYFQECMKYLEDENTFRQEKEDPGEKHAQVVNEWADKWNEIEVISIEVSDWVRVVNSKPALIYANVKTHKENWPYKYIISARGTDMEELAKWIEIQLKSFAQIHAAYIRDTLSFLQHLEKLNEKWAPFPNRTKMISLAIKNFYPNCTTKKCIEAVEITLINCSNYPEDWIQCICEALIITMSCNNGEIAGRHFTQIDGAIYISEFPRKSPTVVNYCLFSSKFTVFF